MDEKKKKTRKILLFVIIGLVVLALIAGLILFLTRKYTVSFDSAGGSAVAEEKVPRGNPAPRPQDPTWEGYDFMGWYLDDKEYNFNLPVKQSFTLTARWSESKYVTFMVDGEPFAVEHIVNGRVIFPEAPKLDGFSFVGWLDEYGKEMSDSQVFTDNTTLTAKYRVYIPVTSIKFEKASYVMERGDTLKPKLVVSPSNWVENIGFTTSNSAVATVSPEGEITANGGGTALITVNTESGQTAITEVTVKVTCKSLKFASSDLKIKKGDNIKLNLEINPGDTTEQLTFTSSAKGIVEVDEEGNIKGKDYGIATITATCGKQKATITITVWNPATSISISPKTITLSKPGETRKLEPTLTPKDVQMDNITYISSNPKVATVETDGTVKAVAGGKCMITLTTDSGHKATVDVIVNEHTFNVNYEWPSGATKYYLFYRESNAPVIKVSFTVSVWENGENKASTFDASKLTVKGLDDSFLCWDASKKEFYASAQATTGGGLSKAKQYTVSFEYNYGSGTLTSESQKINVEPVLEIKGTTDCVYSSADQTITLPASEEPVIFKIEVNQKATATVSGGLMGGGESLTTFTFTAESHSGKITIKTKGGQKITLTVK